ncbi:killer toxin subunits alpha/beta-like protein [Achaetomium macrosporum]|uniref:chitinase n=1 Tax=Achaetomium macrosporum TaxID=79813 RepID=A0AAN7HA70_9PEZI|nr:killer toxin subunits alpha/beta-like protein [Achaetomium macrosporum]
MVRMTYSAAVVLAIIGGARAAGRGNSVYFSGTDPCPLPCEVAGPDPSNWTAYHSLERMGYCSASLVLSFAVFNPLDDPNNAKTIRACTLSTETADDSITHAAQHKTRRIPGTSQLLALRADNSTNGDSGRQHPAPAQAQAAWKNSLQVSDASNVISQAQHLEEFIQRETTLVSGLGPSLFFLHQPDSLTSIGIYAGTGVETQPLVNELANFIRSRGYSGDSLIQACSSHGVRPAAGIVVSTGPSSLITAQRAVKDWANSTCVSTGYDEYIPLAARLDVSGVSLGSLGSRSVSKRATCRTVDVQSGNLCADLARKCGISVADLLKYNPQANFCTTLKVPQKVCCTAGELPIPKPDAQGNCATYTVKSGDSCWGISDSLSGLVSTADIEAYNKNTWGWGGCGNLQANTAICLSPGRPPLPMPVPDAECGPLKPGTTAPPAGTNLASLNPCPLNACCNVWGHCGTTDEFCRPMPAGQAPGAPQPQGGPNCVSNCGTGTVNNASPPASFFKVGYFEGYGVSRPCDRVDIRTVNHSGYTHIHFAFATVTADKYEVNMGPTINQFYYFKDLTGVKKILSFGGWTFSTDPATYGIFRTGVRSENRNTMAKNIADFIISNNLDGVDIDWEYPAAPDIPDVPSGDPAEGSDYLKFLVVLKNLLPRSKTVSFAAPAGYWYLKGFPMDSIAKVVDYVIYMTYDLHGQWDYDNKWADPGCPAGNCLRSHVNMTETLNSLSMITKAGVPANKVVVGVSSYGRSFQMTTSGCTGPMCTYTGPKSGAKPGKCTGTAGYLANSEIKAIIRDNPSAKTWVDSDSMSNILVYDSTQWVGYMDDENKERRAARYKTLNFLGTSDWAISLGDDGLEAPAPITIGPNETYPVPQNAVNPQLHSSCEPYKYLILEAWSEAGELTKAPPKWSRWNKYQSALDTYLGPRSGQVPWFSDDIWLNFKRHYEAHYGGQGSQRGLYNYYYCDVDQMPQKVKDKITRQPCPYFSRRNRGVAAKTWRFPGVLGQIDGAVPFTSLKNIANEGDSFEVLRTQIDRWSNTVRALTIYHETAHWQDISRPTCDANEKYEPEVIASHAKYGGDEGYNFNLKNAHSWTLTTTAMWMMQRWQDIGVPMPAKPIPTKAPIIFDDPESETGGADGIWLDELDEDWFDPAQVNPAEFTPLAHYGSLGNGPLSDCTEGKYEFEDQCLLVCNLGQEGRACSKNDDGTWECKGCDKRPTTCTEGLYQGWDACRSNCLNGLCSMNAGENGIRCRC